ncbi:RUS family member 1-like isoform X2 [Portunus trituberculatus]|uniref:RUS family member 1-like isoform X2 n=1 Tax=Portunus trituberculatus TaxID=210409 RepID=UPI001E1CEA1E|nr:RUS family member 1-like isoform X2 [Portunus trituberculatus]
MGERVMYRERKGPSGQPLAHLYLPSIATFRSVDLSDGKGGAEGMRARVAGWAREVFLPQGYPESVSPDYLHYQFWDSMQAYCSSIAGALSLQATLVGLGVGEGTATPLAATLSWLLKDGSGMVASIFFAYWKGTQLDCNLKQWRLFADVTNDLNSMVRLVGPALPVPFLAVLCLSGVLGALVGVAGGSTRAALAVHQARCDNMADVSAKDGSQETLVNLAALFTNLTLLPFFTATLSTTWVTFLICVWLHLLANYKAMRALTLASLNRPRLLHLLSSWAAPDAPPVTSLPSPAEANLAEPLLFGPAFIADYFPHGFRVSMGCSLHWALEQCGGDPGELFRLATGAFRGQKYMLCGNLQRRQLHIVYRSGITTQEELKAVVTAFLCVLNYCHVTQDGKLISCISEQMNGD